MSGLIVLGTEPLVGKTTVSSALISALMNRGKTVAVMKPIETGCAVIPMEQPSSPDHENLPCDQAALDSLSRLAQIAGPPPASMQTKVPHERLSPKDAPLLMNAACFDFDLNTVNPYRFEPTLEPGVAARLAEVHIDADHILRCYRSLASAAEVVIIEGPAGLFDPLGPDLLFIDLIALMQLPVLLISGFSPGTISNCIMTIEALRHRKINLTGLLFNRRKNQPRPEDAANPFQIESHCGPLVLGVFPHLSSDQRADTKYLGQRLEVHVDLAPLFAALKA